jgi:hypothetical protein
MFVNKLKFNHLYYIPVRCTFELYVNHLTTNIMVLRTWDLYTNYS